MPASRPRSFVAALALHALVTAGCQWVGTKVSVVNRFERASVRNVVFRGAAFAGALAPQERFAPRPCVPGEGRAYYERTSVDDAGVLTWERRRTQTVYALDGVEELPLVLTEADDERDPDAPNRFGH